MIHIHYSNRFEILADVLGERVLARTKHPLCADVVAVSHPGLRRWLSLELATRKGVAANIEFPLPATLIWRLLRAVLPDIDERSAFDPESLRWAVAAELEGVGASSGPLRTYLDAADARMRHDLASRLARQLDQYLVYRPDWVRRWANGERALPGNAPARLQASEAWQSHLLRVLRERLGNSDWLSALERFGAEAKAGNISADVLPAQVHLFAAASLSPAYVDVLAQFGEVIDVYLYVLNPCREYWGDLLPVRAQPPSLTEREALYFTAANPLLGSWGRVGRDLIDRLQGLPSIEQEHYAQTSGDSRLASLHREILDLEPAHQLSASTDRSIQVHVCHSPMREMEVLHDQLLALFDAIPDLDPSDVVVMTPRIDAYAPAIRAVFTRTGTGSSIPFAVADRQSVSASAMVGAFFDLIETGSSRLQADAVLGLLGRAPIRRRFGIEEEDLAPIALWVEESGVRWGADAERKAASGLPAEDLHTWRFGIDRMLLGVAMAGERRQVFAGLHPYDGTAGGDYELLGRFVGFVDAVLAFASQLEGMCSVSDWSGLLRRASSLFFAPDGIEESELQSVLRALDALTSNAANARFEQEVPLDVIVDELKALLPGMGAAAATESSLMFSGRVTFCELVPLRSVPFRIVCLVGMNDGAYPRRGAALGFDLMARYPRKGDRNPRDDDRYLFLEAILAARDSLYVSYVGMDQRDNTAIPPSPLVSELLDYLAGSDTQSADTLVEVHPLARFSPRYFSADSALFSYDEASFQACLAASGSPEPPPAMGRLANAPDVETQVPLERFIACLLQPPRFFLEQGVRLRVPRDEERVSNVEPFRLEGLARYQTREWLMEGFETDLTPEVLQAVLQGDGQLPSGPLGVAVAQLELEGAERHWAACQRRLEGTEGLEIDVAIGGLRITGVLPGWHRKEARVVAYRPGRLRARDRLAIGLEQLFATLVHGKASGEFVADKTFCQLAMLENTAYATAALEHYAGLYREAHCRALPFFAESGWQFVQHAPDDLPRARRAARAEWLGTSVRQTGPAPWVESRIGENLLAFRGTEPLGAEFEALSTALLGDIARRLSERSIRGERG